MDSATADTVSAQPEVQLLLCLAAIANALTGELQPRTFPAAVWRTEAEAAVETWPRTCYHSYPLDGLVHRRRGRHAGLPWRIVQPGQTNSDEK